VREEKTKKVVRLKKIIRVIEEEVIALDNIDVHKGLIGVRRNRSMGDYNYGIVVEEGEGQYYFAVNNGYQSKREVSEQAIIMLFHEFDFYQIG
jgi:hypothetical protein